MVEVVMTPRKPAPGVLLEDEVVTPQEIRPQPAEGAGLERSAGRLSGFGSPRGTGLQAGSETSDLLDQATGKGLDPVIARVRFEVTNELGRVVADASPETEGRQLI